MSKVISNLDRDEMGKPLPTLHNKEVFETLRLEIGIEGLLKLYERDYLDFSQKEMFDPRSPNVFFRTKEQALQANKYSTMLNQMDRKYIESRKTSNDPYYREAKANFEKMSDKEFIEAFNNEVGNKGWTSSRAIYLSLIHDELDRREFDYSSIGDKHGFHIAHKIKLVGNKIRIK